MLVPLQYTVERNVPGGDCFTREKRSTMSSTTTPQISLLRLPYQMLRPMYERTSIHTRVIDEVSDV